MLQPPRFAKPNPLRLTNLACPWPLTRSCYVVLLRARLSVFILGSPRLMRKFSRARRVDYCALSGSCYFEEANQAERDQAER